ncbi:hypothetical protein [Nocardioides sp. SYSU D00038]|uniref:DUF7657 domain-containing protein n=1 Tax=Nocardioides sp. SYSU D00038 TaxID=2812554 RepID=UPI0019680F7D|nr:hypothetical protein [Nocardioides sp. SYSU D00038]
MTPPLPRHDRRWWDPVRPAVLGVVAAAFLVLVALDVSGSSIGVLAERRGDDGVVAGEPRPIRSDEYALRTPLALSAARQDFPATSWVGLSEVDNAAAAHAGPTRGWEAALTPQNWGYLLLGPSRGLAWTWWWSFAVCLAASFLLVLRLTRSPVLALGIAAAITFNPYTAWWSAPAPAPFVGYAVLAAELLLAAWACRRRWGAVGLAAVAGLVGASFALLLYPGWQVPLGVVLAALCVGVLLDGRVPWRRVVLTVGVAAVTMLAPLGVWYVQHHDAIAATRATYYPGQRVSEAGTGSWVQLSTGPLAPWLAGDAGATLGRSPGAGPYDNLSESASSWLPLPVLGLVMALALVLALRGRSARRRTASPAAVDPVDRPVDRPVAQAGEPVAGPATAAALTVAVLVLLAWAFLPLPEAVGKVTLLSMVPPGRLPLPLGTAFLLLVAVLAGRTGPRAWRPVLAGGAVVAVVASGWVAWSASRRLSWDVDLVPGALVVLSGAGLAAVVVGVLAGGLATRVCAAVLGVAALVGWALVNPLQHGAAPLLQSRVATALHRHADAGANPRVAVYGGLDVVALVRAAGFQSVSGQTLYPSEEVMEALVPDERREWNNYAQYQWAPGAAGSDARIDPVRGTFMQLTVDPCSPVLLDLVDPGWVVAESRLDGDCLDQVDAFRARDKHLRLYRVTG